MGVFSFWELSFSGIFAKLSKEWDLPVWLVPSSNVSLLVLLYLFSFFIFFFFYPELYFSFLCGIREKARPEIASFDDDRGFKKRHQTEPRLNHETRGPRDRKLRRRQGIRDLMLSISQHDENWCFLLLFFFYFFLFLSFFLFCFFSSSSWVFALSSFSLFFFLFFLSFFFTLVSSLSCFFFFFYFFFPSHGDGRDGWV